MKYNKEQKSTLLSFRKINDNLFFINIDFEYFLDEVLEKGIKSTLDVYLLNKNTIKRLNKKGSACTSFNFFDTNSFPYVARNFDYIDAPTLAIWTHPKNGYKSLSFTTFTFLFCGKKTFKKVNDRKLKKLFLAPYIPMDGINEKGLQISILELHQRPTIQLEKDKDITTTMIIRAILDKCANVDEAIEMFKKYNMRSALFINFHFQITDKSGKTAIIEYVKSEMFVIFPKENNKTLCLTNFCLSKKDNGKQLFGLERFNYVKNTLSNKNGILNINEGMKILENCYLKYPMFKGLYYVSTLYSAIYDLNNLEVNLCVGLNYEEIFKLSLNMPCHFTKENKTKIESIPNFIFAHGKR